MGVTLLYCLQNAEQFAGTPTLLGGKGTATSWECSRGSPKTFVSRSCRSTGTRVRRRCRGC